MCLLNSCFLGILGRQSKSSARVADSAITNKNYDIERSFTEYIYIEWLLQKKMQTTSIKNRVWFHENLKDCNFKYCATRQKINVSKVTFAWKRKSTREQQNRRFPALWYITWQFTHSCCYSIMKVMWRDDTHKHASNCFLLDFSLSLCLSWSMERHTVIRENWESSRWNVCLLKQEKEKLRSCRDFSTFHQTEVFVCL